MLPASWVMVPVVGSYVDSTGLPMADRFVKFASDLVVSIDGTVIVPRTISVKLEDDGTLPVGFSLASTNDPGLSLVGWTYRVTEQWPGGRSFEMIVPFDAALIDMSVVDASTPDPVTTDLYLRQSDLGTVVAHESAVVAAQAAADAAQADADTGIANAAAVQTNLNTHAAAADPHPQYATDADVSAQLAALVASAPGTLNTLNELAAALGNDPNFATTIATALASKIDTTQKGAVNGVVPLGGGGRIDPYYRTKLHAYAPVSSGVVAFNLAASDDFYVDLIANVTSSSFTNGPATGYVREGTITLKQDATGGRTFTPPAGTRWPNRLASIPTAAANAEDQWGYRVDNRTGTPLITFYPCRDIG